MIVTAVVLASAAAVPATAGAAASRDKQAEAAALQDQIEATDLQISALAEQLNEAAARRDAHQASVKEAEARIAAAKEEVQRILGIVRDNAVSLYRQHSTGSVAWNTGKPSDLVSRDQYAEAQAERDNELLNKLDVAQQDLHLRRADATRARDAAAFETDAINTHKAAWDAARAQQQALLNQVKGEIAAEIAAERARRAAAARALFDPNVGPPNGSAAQAIAYARAVIGAGYSTNPRTGPTYDCSGLTWSAWHAAGVSIPNSSGGQYNGLPKVPIAAAQPGDLIFWGPGGSSHVALYVGGGMIIDASSGQGQVVERPIWGSPLPWAARVV
ncbi:MAG: NlpC/P60 family protein [Acidimicrobiia bacterium]